MKFRLIKEKNPVNKDYKVPLVIRAIGSGLFLGYIPFASGTFGSILGLLIFLIPGFSDFHIILIALLVCFGVGVYVSEQMKKRYGDDPPEVVIDEIAGLWFTYIIAFIIFEFFFKAKSLNPTDYFITKLLFGLVGLIIFRIFDILKLQPSKYFDELKSGLGIMLDDIFAGLYAGILTPVFTHFLWFKVILRLWK
jgi:phosphatidylglycerophosphatase A